MTNKEILEMAKAEAKERYEEMVSQFREDKAETMRAIRHAEGVIARGDIEFMGDDMVEKATKEEKLLTSLGLEVKCHKFSKRIVIEVLDITEEQTPLEKLGNMVIENE